MPPEGNLFLQETDLQLEQASFDLMVKADDYYNTNDFSEVPRWKVVSYYLR